MSHLTLLSAGGALCLVLILLAMWLLRSLERQEKLAARIQLMRRGYETDSDSPPDPGGGGMLRIVAKFGRLLARSGLLPASTLTELEETLIGAGFHQANALGLFVGAKILLVVLLPLLATFALHGLSMGSMPRILAIAGAAIAGLLLPDMVLRRTRKRYLAGVELGLPDALDMLVICSEAGLGLEPALERVAVEIGPAHPNIGIEMALTSNELRILADRRIALTNMGTRTGLDTLKRLGSTLIQTMQYGTPLSQALRTLSAEMRYEMLMRFEARAARLPVLLTVPMILFILPCIFLVVGGPAGLTVARTFVHH